MTPNQDQQDRKALCRPRKADDFITSRRFDHGDIYADIRRFRWHREYTGYFEPQRHYLDFCLTGNTRQSRLVDAEFEKERNPGDIVFLPAGDKLWGRSGPDEHHMLCLSLDSSFVDRVMDGRVDQGNFRPSLDLHNSAVRGQMQRLARELMAPGLASDVLVQSLAMSLVVELTRHFQGRDARCHEGREGLDNRRLRQAREYIEDRLDSRLTLTAIAEACSVSPRHLSRFFKEKTGMTIGDFIASARIARARELLASSDMPLKDVASRCGFQTSAAFGAAFRRAAGCTPGDYRRRRA